MATGSELLEQVHLPALQMGSHVPEATPIFAEHSIDEL
jgi:hypothetical protein